MHQLSVIIPAYNEEKLIVPLLQSLRCQSVHDFSIIVISNNSTDRTMDVARRYTKHVYNCSVQGSVPARNLGARKAATKYVAFLDADCVVNETWAENMLAAFARKPPVQAVTGSGTYIEPNIWYNLLYNCFAELTNLSLILKNALGMPYITTNNMAVERKVFLELGGLDNLIIEDHWFSLKFGKKGYRARYVHNAKVRYSSRRFHADGFFKTLTIWAKGLKKISLNEYHPMTNEDD